MNQEEQQRIVALTRVLEGLLTVPDAARLIAVSVRHCRRLLAEFRREGPAALAHGNRGHPPHNRLAKRVRQRVVQLAKTTYAGFNDHHLTEMLADEHALHVSRPTVRRWLREAGLPSPHTRRPPRHRQRRQRMPQEGMLLQLDGSAHAWLEGRGPRLVLHGAIDDATSHVPAATFRLQEDAHGHFLVLHRLVATCGVPGALYGDGHSIFTQTLPPSLSDQLRGLTRGPTQFGRALRDLGIHWIPASSPQAKGRIERLWGTFQDRLVSELRRAKARTLQDANTVLAAFLPRYNARFAQAPAVPASAYRPLPPDVDLNDICCFQYPRTVAHDNTVRLGPHLLQILPDAHRHSYAKTRVVVHHHLDDTLTVSYHRRRLRSQLLTSPRPSPPAPRRIPPKAQTLQQRPTWRPPPDHPWRRYEQTMRRTRLRKAGVTFSLDR